MLHQAQLDTPCLALDLDLLDGNLKKMQTMVDRAGKKLRPHAKTHKCSALAKRQLELGAIGVCVAKVSEAEALIRSGITEILVTGPVATPMKIQRLVGLLDHAPSLMTVVDHPEGVDLLNAAAQEHSKTMDVLLDIDVGLRRTGARLNDARHLSDHILACGNLRIRGIQAYAGHLQHVSSYEERAAQSLHSLREVVPLFHELTRKTPDCVIFSATGTGTADIDFAVAELTEIQAGSYTCMDEEYFSIGAADHPTRFEAFAPALRLLTTVVSVNQSGFVTVDAGLKALYHDGAVPRVLSTEYVGMTYDWFGDEYGKLSFPPGVRPPALGAVVELVVSHCDPTINLFDHFHLVRGNEVVGCWSIDLRGCSQ